MRMTSSIVVGLIGGLLFFGHAMINNSHAWPLVWPALAGGVAVLATHRARDAGYGSDLAKAGLAGISAGLVFIIASWVELRHLELLTKFGLGGLAFAALLGLLAALVVGGLTHPLAVRRA